MSLLRARLHLPRRSPGSGPRETVAPPALAGDPGLQLLEGGAAPNPTGDARVEEDPDPIPLRPAPVRHAAPDGRPATRTRRLKKGPAPAATGLLPDEPAVAPEDVERPLRLILVEEVPEVVAHVREMLRGQPSLRLVEVVADGRQVAREVRELRADVVLVDSLLQGRPSGIDVLERLRSTMPGIAVVALGLPADARLAERVRSNADAVVALPFGTIDLARGIRDAHGGRAVRDPASATRIVAVYAAKGGVG